MEQGNTHEKRNSDRVREIYERSGLTYDELSALTGIKPNTLACYLSGRRNPNDIVVSVIEEKVNSFLNGGGEYINKSAYRDNFAEAVYDIIQNCPVNEQPREIMKAFDKLPTVSITVKK